MTNCFEDLKWRGLIKDSLGDVKSLLNGEPMNFYVGVDCTGNGSGLHVGHLMAFIVCKHLQKFGHNPIIIKGIATAMMGDPSGRDTERPQISLEEVTRNSVKIESQIKHLLGEDTKILSNYDWISKMSYIDFMREMGKVITLNQMLNKTIIKNRIEREQGISIQEATYMLLQGFDALHLYRTENCKLEIGGSDQWTNIEVGAEAIRKKENGEFFGLTWDLIIDPTTGKKYGKTAEGKAVWLDSKLTSPFEMYQFFLNTSDEQCKELIKKFTLLDKEEIEAIIEQHRTKPSFRILQKRLAYEVTSMVHSKEEADIAKATTEILFGKPSKETLESMDDTTITKVFNGVPTFEISKEKFDNGTKFIDACVECGAFASKGELRKLIQSNGIKTNYNKVDNVNMTLTVDNLINGKFMTIQKGKKANILVIAK